ncbi:hypothetical protein NH341_10055 [Tenacibaculum sp. XPcli2-G]|uniref:hypothetical protein n=1 Tax=Tenacibaculum sp. XPcli2-G TaxID=2954503 RepID=UPI00209712E0|nr:hypothetical protein [Tenacibaculum sp. XPcli2-G]MCO7185771.1 hypothetical protein [Tenacibaculum sp. XPcli2-G]
MKKFDIESFNKHKDSIRNEYNRILDDGTTIRQWESTNEYIEITKSKNSYFEESRSFYKNGNLKMYVERFPNQFLKYLIEYNENGKIIEETDYDKDFDYTWEDLLKLLKKRKVDILGRYTTIRKEEGNWRFSYVEGIYIYDVIIDGKTGKILQDAKNEFEEGS